MLAEYIFGNASFVMAWFWFGAFLASLLFWLSDKHERDAMIPFVLVLAMALVFGHIMYIAAALTYQPDPAQPAVVAEDSPTKSSNTKDTSNDH